MALFGLARIAAMRDHAVRDHAVRSLWAWQVCVANTVIGRMPATLTAA